MSGADAANDGELSKDETLWSEAFLMLKEGNKGDLGARYALAIASLKRKAEENAEQLDALRDAERSLLQAAKDDAQEALAKAEPRGAGRPEKEARLARDWGAALADAVSKQAKEAADFEADDEPPWAAVHLAQETQQQVNEALEAQGRAESEAQAEVVAQAEQALMMQAEAVAQAQALQEAQAQALSDAQNQAEAMAEMQLQLQAEAHAQAQQASEMMGAQTALRGGLRPPMPPSNLFNGKFGQAEGLPNGGKGGLPGADDTAMQLQMMQQALLQSGAADPKLAEGLAQTTEAEVQQQLLALLGQKSQLDSAAAALGFATS